MTYSIFIFRAAVVANLVEGPRSRCSLLIVPSLMNTPRVYNPLILPYFPIAITQLIIAIQYGMNVSRCSRKLLASL